MIKLAEFRGDYFKLWQPATSSGAAEYILFCSAHFIAESGDILSRSHRNVILPKLEASCSKAGMAKSDDVRAV
jgi:quinolinate synthase